MALSITHSTVVVTADDGTSEVGSNEWNAGHTISGLGANVQTFLETPSSANLISAVTDETGTGALVFANTPTLVTPILGTPTSGALTNCTGPVKRFAAIYFYPIGNEPPATNYATFDTRNSHPVLDFDDTTAEGALWTGVLPATYNGGGITVAVASSATSATTGTAGWTVEIERVGTAQDTDADSFASAQTITAANVSGTSGIVTVGSVNISDGANMDSVAAGEQFRIRVKRDVANDTAVGDVELHWVSMVEQ